MNFIKNNILSIVLVLIICFLLIRSCNRNIVPSETDVVTLACDTVWIYKDSIVKSSPQIIHTVSPPVEHWNTEYLEDPEYDGLLEQYKDLSNDYFSINVIQDTLKIDSIGYVRVLDSVSKNQILARTFKYTLKYPLIKETKTITVIEPPKRQLYIGLGIDGGQEDYLNQVNAELLYKTKKDHMFGINAGVDRDGNIEYGVRSYWKIKLKK